MCGILAIVNNSKTEKVLEMMEGLMSLNHRGQDSCGISSENSKIKTYGLAQFLNVTDLKENENTYIGHVRYGTSGELSDDVIQPIVIEEEENRIALVHNGNIINTERIKEVINLRTNIKEEYKNDSILITKLLNVLLNEKNSNIKDLTNDEMKDVINEYYNLLEGSFSIVAIIKGWGVIAMRDKLGIRPMCLGENKKGDYVISSETCAIDVLDYYYKRDIMPGETIIIRNNSKHYNMYQIDSVLKPCIFEYIYFARSDSYINNVSVYDTRYKMGLLLGEKIKREVNIDEIDVVIPVPDTSTIISLGVCKVLKKPFVLGLIKNAYIKRTFIMENEEKIRKNIKRKLTVIKEEVKGKNVLIVDDSIVRGNTSRHIIRMIKDAGSKNVYMASGAPPVVYPNNYGIYIPTEKELIASGRTLKEVEDILGIKKVIYNDLEELSSMIKESNKKIEGFEVTMFKK